MSEAKSEATYLHKTFLALEEKRENSDISFEFYSKFHSFREFNWDLTKKGRNAMIKTSCKMH